MKLPALLAPGFAVLLAACGNSAPLLSAGDARADAARFLMQATFGPTMEDIDALAERRDYDAWLREQRDAPISLELPYMEQQKPAESLSQSDRLEAWWRFAINGPDQLRQRMAFALSEIMVISTRSVLAGEPVATAAYYDLLATHALGNYRDLLESVTLSPAMGHFLNMMLNRKPDPDAGIRSDENFAREVMQLFSLGLVQLNLDGSPKLDDNGVPLPTFSQSDVANLARVFTGWGWAGGSSDAEFYTASPAWTEPMAPYQGFHDTSAKVIVGNTPVPAGMQAQDELDLALDTIFHHPNVGPFIGRQLIQRFVTSNPSPAYVARVAQAFNDNGQGVRGDLFAVARAMLLDPEARAPSKAESGKLREPVLRLSHLWRAFHASAENGRYDYLLALASFNQSPLDAPSVFNFFRPDGRPVGVISSAGLVAPEFGITTETTIITGANELRRAAGRYRTSAGPNSTAPGDILLDFRPWEEEAADAEKLVEDLDLVLMAGQMPAAMRETLVEYVESVPVENPGARLNGAVYLIVSSSQSALQK